MILYNHDLDLPDLLISSNEALTTLKNQSRVTQSPGNADVMRILQRASELQQDETSVLYEISEKLKYLITYSKFAQACYNEDRSEFNDSNDKKKQKVVSCPGTTFPKE